MLPSETFLMISINVYRISLKHIWLGEGVGTVQLRFLLLLRFMYLFERVIHKEEETQRIFYQLVHSPSGWNVQGWSRLKPEVCSFSWVFHMGAGAHVKAIFCFSSRHISSSYIRSDVKSIPNDFDSLDSQPAYGRFCWQCWRHSIPCVERWD